MQAPETLSSQERVAVSMHNERIQAGETEEMEIWADDFTRYLFYGHEDFVIDIGCGLGRVVPVLCDYGIEMYFGIDPSVEHIKFCKSHFPEHHFQVGEVRQLGTGDLQGFGGFIMLNVLMHTPKAELTAILQAVRKSQLKGAVGFLNTLHPSVAEEVPDEAAHLEFSFYESQEVVTALESTSFDVVRIREHERGCMYHVVAI